jgi:hypothetical protein
MLGLNPTWRSSVHSKALKGFSLSESRGHFRCLPFEFERKIMLFNTPLLAPFRPARTPGDPIALSFDDVVFDTLMSPTGYGIVPREGTSVLGEGHRCIRQTVTTNA